jgi:hypothetical protein
MNETAGGSNSPPMNVINRTMTLGHCRSRESQPPGRRDWAAPIPVSAPNFYERILNMASDRNSNGFVYPKPVLDSAGNPIRPAQYGPTETFNTKPPADNAEMRAKHRAAFPRGHELPNDHRGG